MPPVAESCRHTPRVAALAQDRLTSAERTATEDHLRTCAACRQAFQTQTVERFPEIPNYTILEQIGQGGFGRVYKAVHHDKERIEALKVASTALPLRAQYFVNEVHLVAQLQHPNIATLYDARLDADPPYYAMEYIDGAQLSDYLRRNHATLRDVLRLMGELCAALEYAHARGVIHRDIKPQNILVTADGHARIVDFGIAKRVGIAPADGDATPADSPVGTIGWMAPEQLSGAPVDRQADVFALGVLLIYLLFGKVDRQRPGPALERALAGVRVPRPADLSAIISRCIAADPAQRYNTCAELAADLERYAAGQTVAARSDADWRYRLARGGAYALRQHPRAVEAALLTLLVGTLGVLLWTLQASRLLPIADDERVEVALIAFDAATFEAADAGAFAEAAPDYRADDAFSRRLLYADLQRRLATGGARLVVWDYFFRRCRPEYDAALTSAFGRAPMPVVIGAAALDASGDPDLCPELIAAASGWGLLFGKDLASHPRHFLIDLALKRGTAPPLPSLAVAGFAALAAPDTDGHYSIGPHGVVIRYRRHELRPGESRWAGRLDQLPATDEVGVLRAQAGVDPDDRFIVSELPRVALRERPIPVHSAGDVLRASAETLRMWLDGRAVVIGQMIGDADRHTLEDGSTIYGCEVQAGALRKLLSSDRVVRFTKWELLLRIVVGCVAGLMLARLLIPRVKLPAWLIVGGAGLALTAAVANLSLAALRVRSPLAAESVILAAAVLASFAVVAALIAARAARDAVAARALAALGGSTVPSRFVAETKTLAPRPRS